jgi:hypothetical protein
LPLQGWLFTVLSVDGQRIEQVRVEPLSSGALLVSEESHLRSPNFTFRNATGEP